jgi:hypothetical protein
MIAMTSWLAWFRQCELIVDQWLRSVVRCTIGCIHVMVLAKETLEGRTMQIFDPDFESSRLAMLAKQYPDIVQLNGEVVFNAEDDEDRLSGTSWNTESDDTLKQISEFGFKFDLIALLDDFIQYRGQCAETPNKEGVIRFGGGNIDIVWLAYGSNRL